MRGVKTGPPGPDLARAGRAATPAGSVYLLVVPLLLFDSLHFVFARLLLPHLPATLSALYVLGVATVELGLFLGWRGQIRWEVFRRAPWFFLLIGFLVAASTTLSYASVAYIDAGTASLLAQASTLFSLALGLVWLRDRLARAELGGAVMALAGVFAISFQPGNYLRLGSLIVLAGSLAYACHAAVVKRYGGGMAFASFFFFRVASTTAFLLLFALARGQVAWPGAAAWPVLLLAGTSDVVISRVLYYLALRRLRMSNHAILLTLSPVLAILWSLLLFAEVPAPQGLLGGAAVVAGVALMSAAAKRKG